MKVEDFSYQLPENLIAQVPPQRRSDGCLLYLHPQQKNIQSTKMADFTNLLQPEDLLVFNDTQVMMARMYGMKLSGGRVEILLERCLEPHRMQAKLRASRLPKAGDKLLLLPEQHASDDNAIATLTVLERRGSVFELALPAHLTVDDAMAKVGQVPLPPYMKRPAVMDDRTRYQTIFAQHKGAIACPTAGLHFDKQLMDSIENKGISVVYITLHTGAGSFEPVRSTDIAAHQPQAEYMEVSQRVCDAVLRTRQAGGRVIAVGTSALRALETAIDDKGKLKPYAGDTSLFVYPGYQFRCVDALLSNFHMPRSSLLMLVAAFAGQEFILAAYQRAIELGYRFLSYGDAMFIDHRIT